jgi:hypothetical protein
VIANFVFCGHDGLFNFHNQSGSPGRSMSEPREMPVQTII